MPKLKNSNGEGSISYEADRKTYRAAIVDNTGKRIRKRFKTKQEATEWIITTRADMFRGEYIPESTITVGEWVFDYLNTYKKSKIKASSLARYLCTYNHLEPISHVPLKDLTPYSVQKFFNDLPATLSWSSRKKVQELLSAAINKAVTLGVIKDILKPVETTITKKAPKQVEVFTIDEIHTILEWIKTSQYYSRYYLFVKLAVYSGARLGELLALPTKNVYDGYIRIDTGGHAVSGKMIIDTPKTIAGTRRITIPPELAAELQELGAGHTFVFHTRNGTCWNTHNVERAWRKIMEQTGIRYRGFHSLRHTHATQLLSNWVPLLEVAKRLGHSKPSTTLNLYGHAIPGYDEQLPQQILNIFDNQ